jgi:hypothetical protein
MPPIHTNPPVQSVFNVQELLQPAGGSGGVVGVLYAIGVDVGVGYGVHVGAGVHVGTGVNVGVGVPVGIGVSVGVGVGVDVGTGVDVGVGVSMPVGVGVGVPIVMVNCSLHAVTAACGSPWGTVGATCLVWESFPLVKATRTASPMVRRAMTNKYQCFFR